MINKKQKKLISNLMVWISLVIIISVHIFGALNNTLGSIIGHSTLMIILSIVIGIEYYIRIK